MRSRTLSLAVLMTVLIAFPRCSPEPHEMTELPADELEVTASTESTDDRSLRVMSWNVRGSAVRYDPDHLDKIVETIREIDPNVVMLQEVHRRTRAGGGLDQFDVLARTLGMNGCFGESLAVGEHGSYGNAILTDGTIISSRRLALPGQGEPRTLLECRSEWQTLEIPLMTTHLTAWDRANRRSRTRQTRAIEAMLETDGSPLVILGGDFNASLTSPEMVSLATKTYLEPVIPDYVVTHRGTGRSYDHLLAGDGWTIEDGRIIRQGPSDHWPVIATLQLSKGGRP